MKTDRMLPQTWRPDPKYGWSDLPPRISRESTAAPVPTTRA
jgi:hypothetical protein